MDENKTIIASSDGRKDIYKQFSKDNGEIIFGYRIMPLASYRQSLISYLDSDETEFSRLYLQVRNNISPGNIYYEELRYPAFFRYFYDFANEMADNNITPEDLPDDYDNKDKKEILSWLCAQDLNHKKIRNTVNEITDAGNVIIYDSYEDNLTNWQLRQKLIEKGAQLMKPSVSVNRHSECRYGRNSTREIISIAQYIVANKDKYKADDIVLMVNDMENYLPIIDQVFTQYNIPYSCTTTGRPAVITRFTDFLKYALSPNTDTFLKAYTSGCFGEVSASFLEYQEHFRLNYEQLLQPFTLVSDWDWQKTSLCLQQDYDFLLKKEQEAEGSMKMIRELIAQIPFNSSLQNITSFIYNLFLKETDQSDIPAMQAIYDLCINNVPVIDNNAEVLLYLLQMLRVSETISYDDAVTVCSPYQTITGKKLAIVIGCSQISFPKTINRSGFFDELYLQNVRNYPSLTDRTRHYNEQLAAVYDNIPEVIYSYALTDDDGKALELSSFVARRTEEPAQWPLTENNHISDYEEQLNSDTARKLYLRKNRLYASPSGFESYVGCPFRFFLEKGLRLYSNEMFSLQVNTVGTMQHAIMEEMFKNDREFNRETLEEYINYYFDSLKELFVNDKDRLEIQKQTLIENLLTKIEFLSISKSDARFKPVGFEEKVFHQIPMGDYAITMHGIIDRVDESADRFMIVDYKSSDKSISQENIYRGKSLQLLTYLLVYSLSTAKKPSGMAYYSLKNDTKDTRDSETEQDTAFRNNKYKAYLTDDMTRDEKNYYSYANFTVNAQQYFNVITEIYQTLAEKILSGDISVDPVNDACAFCHFRKICHSNYDSSGKSDYIIDPPQEDEDDAA